MNSPTINSSIATPPSLQATTGSASTVRDAPNEDLKLQVATQHCAKGRQAWSSGLHQDALTQFRHALIILETILGTEHILVAQLYHWMGLIFQEQQDFRQAEQCFIKYLRIRYALSNHENKALPPDSNTLEAQVSLSHLWQAQGFSSSKSFEMIQQLQQSVQLELEGDAVMNSGAHQSPNYVLAMKTYQQAMNVFPDAHHDAIMSKLAMCYHKAKGKGTKTSTGIIDLSNDTNHRHPNYLLDQAVVWHRMSLKVFCTSCRFAQSIMEPSSFHHGVMTSHPEYQTIQSNLEAVLQDYYSFDFSKVKQYLERGDARKSVLHQFAAEEAMSAASKNTPGNATSTNDIDDLANARKEYQAALKIEKSIFQGHTGNNGNGTHMVILNLQKELSQLDQTYIARLEEERAVSLERIRLLEHQSNDWISTVRHQENQLSKLQDSLQHREGTAAEALNAAASKEAELVGWKRKFETVQKEWKASQQRVHTLESENASLQHQLKQTQAKVGQLEYCFKKQDLDFQNFQGTLERKNKEVEGWREQYQVAHQAQQHSQQKCERSEATERELRAQIKDLQSQNVVLKDWNRELQAQHQVQSRSLAVPLTQQTPQLTNPPMEQLEEKDKTIHDLQAKLHEVTHTKDRAIKKLKKYHNQRHQLQGGAEEATEVIIFLEDKVQMLEKALKEQQQSTSPASNKGQSKDEKNSKGGDSGDRASLLARLDKSNDALATLHAEHRAKLAELDALQKSKEELEAGVAESQDIIAMLKKANDERSEKCDELKAENARLKALSGSSGAGLSKSLDLEDVFGGDKSTDTTSNMLIDQVADLELQNEDLREQLEKKIDDNRNLAMAVKSLKGKLDSAKELSVHSNGHSHCTKVTVESADLDHRLKDAEEANNQRAATIETMRQQIMDLTSPNRDDSSGRSSVRATVLEAELREAKKQIATLTTNAMIQQTESKQDSAEKQTLLQRMAELECIIAIASEKEQKLAEKLNETKDKYKSAKEELKEKNMLLHKLSEVETDLEESSSQKWLLLSKNHLEEKKGLASRCAQLEIDLEKTQKANQDLKSHIIALKTEAVASREKGDESEKLNDKVKKLEDNLKEAFETNDKLSKEVRSYKDQMQASRHGMQEENMRLIDQCTQLENGLEEAKARCKELKEEVALEKQYLQTRISELEEEVKRSREQSEAFSLDVSRTCLDTKKENKQLQERCSNLERQLQEAKEQNQKLSSDIAQQSKWLEEKDDQDRQDLEEKCVKLEKKLKKSNEKTQKLSDHVSELQAKLDTIEIEHLEDQDELVNRCQELEQKLFQQNTLEAPKQVDQQQLQKLSELENQIQDLTDENEIIKVQLNIYKKKQDQDVESERNQELVKRCDDLEQELLQTIEQNEQLTEQVDSLSARVRDLTAQIEETNNTLELAQSEIENLKACEAPGDDDFARLLERCTDLEADKAQIEWEMKQQQVSSEELHAIRNERDKLQRELDTALDELSELQHLRKSAADNESTTENDELIEIKKLLDEVTEENAGLMAEKNTIQEQVEKTQKDREEIDSMYQKAKTEIADFKVKLIEAEELVKQAKVEGEELARLLEIEKQVSASRKAAAQSGPEEENELEELYRQAREEMKELEEMLMEAEEQIEHLKSKNEKLSEKADLTRHELIETELSSETVHDLEGLSRDELMKENRKTLQKLQEARVHSMDQQENITILQAQLRDALKFQETRRAPPARKSSGGVGFGGFFGRGKKADEPEKEAVEASGDN
jgi:chromosome segregation ATPase